MLARRVSLVASAGVIAVLMAGAPFSQGKVLADQFTQQIQTLSAQASALSHSIASLSTASTAALGNALASENAIASTQAQLANAQQALDQANRNLANTSEQVQIVHSEYTSDQAEPRTDPEARLRAHRRWIGHRDSRGQQELHRCDGCAHERRPGEHARQRAGDADPGKARPARPRCRNNSKASSSMRIRLSTACRRCPNSSRARRSHTASRRHR